MLLLLGGLLVWAPMARAQTLLVINHIENTNIDIALNPTLTILVSVANTDVLTNDPVSFRPYPDSGWPSGAAITPTDDPRSAIFTWSPTPQQIGMVTNLSVQAHRAQEPVQVTITNFTVTVTSSTPTAGPPYLALPLTLTNITAGMPLTFTAFATNTDGSANALTFSLDTNGLPAGATISNSTPTNGFFQWTPSAAQAGVLYAMRVIVTEQSTPPVSTTQAFTVNVVLTNNCSQYAQFLATVAEGGYVPLTNCPTLVLSNTITIATNVILDGVSSSATIAGNNLLRLFVVQPGASLTLNRVTLSGGSSDSGGAIYNMAGGTVVLSNCVVAGNGAVGSNGSNGANGDNDANYGKDGTDATPGMAGVGGAILNLGSLTANSCQFTNNRATGGNGGNGGSGGSGSYRGGNGRHGGDGALAFGGAVYSAGGSLSLNSCTFSGNSATGGSGGSGGTNGTGAFPGYMGTGGAGAEGSGAAVYSANSAVVLNCAFVNNTAKGGNSAGSGQAGGGYGVKGAPGGNSFGGGVCLLGAGQLISCGFTNDTVAGGNGGDGGSGNYRGGNGGNGGDGVGGCLYNFGGATVVNCGFSGCEAVGGINGIAGGGSFSGRDGQPGSSSTNASSTITTTNVVFATGLPAGAPPAVLNLGSQLTPENSIAAATGGPNSAQPQSGPPIDSQGAAKAMTVPGSNPASANAAPNAAPAINLSGGPTGLPGAGTNRPAVSRKPFVPVTAPAGVVVPGNPTNTVAPMLAAALSPLEEPLPQGMIDFRSADLSQVLDIYSMMVNRTILRPATLPAPTITLTTRGQLTMGEGIQALQAVLALNGIVMVNVGEKFVKAMPEGQGGAAGGRFDTNSAALLPDMGQFVTHVVQLKYAKPSEMVAVLTPFMKIPNAILPIESSQMLVLRDYTENVKRMLELIKELDVAIPSEFVSEVIPIKYAVAGDIASALNSLSSGGGGASTGGGGTTSKRSTRTSGMNRPGGMGGYPGQTTPGMGMQPGAVGTTPAGQPGSSFSDRLRNIISRASATGEIQVIGQTKIISDERTNSLLIYAGKDDMKIIKDIVSKLDVVLAQVLIESVIISVTLNDSHDLGFSYLMHPQNSGRLTGVGALNNNNMLQPGNFGSGGSNAIPSGFSYLMSWGQDLDVTVTAAKANSHAKILQTPYIQTSHNEPATLFVGESRPYPTSSYYGGGAYGGYSSIQQLQIGVTLEVTPLVNPDGLVVMDIHQKIDSFEGNVTIQNVGDVPVTSSKEASAKVSVRDHDTIILGGLIETDRNKSASGVPLLMDIPLLGSLFRASHADEKRTELIVLIRPTVLPTPEIAALTATAQKNKMPGVRGTEKELRDDEKQRLKQADRADKIIPFQPVEKP